MAESPTSCQRQPGMPNFLGTFTKSVAYPAHRQNLTFTHMSGKKQTREEFIGEIMDGTLNYFKVDTKDFSIRVDGDTAQMKVTHTLTAKVYGISGNWTMSGENTYKKRGGIWVRVR